MNRLCIISFAFSIIVSFSSQCHSADAPKTDGIHVPYRLSRSNLTVVRAKVNGKGPFVFLVDSGAPALIVFKNYADRLGLKPANDGWAKVARFEIEGGVKLQDTEARINDPAQLTTGGNRAELARLQFAGIIGYALLAQFEIEFDYTRYYMVWRKLDYKPPAPSSRRQPVRFPVAPQNNAVAQAPLKSDLPPDQLPLKSGFIGIELNVLTMPPRIVAVYKNSPAELAGLKPGDTILEFGSYPIRDAEDWAKRPPVRENGEVILKIGREGRTLSATIKTCSGL